MSSGSAASAWSSRRGCTNLFDQQVALNVDDRLVLGRPVPYVPNNPNFGKGTFFSSPRTFVLSAIVRYQ